MRVFKGYENPSKKPCQKLSVFRCAKVQRRGRCFGDWEIHEFREMKNRGLGWGGLVFFFDVVEFFRISGEKKILTSQ